MDFAFGRIVRITPGGQADVVCAYEGAPNGMQMGADGMLYVTDRLNGVLRIDPADGTVETLCGPERLAPFQGLSDITIARDGTLYFTDQGDSHLLNPCGRVLRMTPDGTVTPVMTGIPGPNGIVLDLSERYVFVAVTYGPAIWRGRLNGDDPADKVGIFQQLPGGYSGTDGLAVSESGGLAACHNRLGTVWLFDADGAPTHRVRAPKGAGRKITNVAYGGADNATLFMTEVERGQILRAPAPEPGARTVGQAGRGATPVR